jgi:hypothetical protein
MVAAGVPDHLLQHEASLSRFTLSGLVDATLRA